MSDDTQISLPVPPPIAAAWQALPPERRVAMARAIVEAWLEPLLLRPVESPVFVPYHTVTAGGTLPTPHDDDMLEE